MKFAQVVLAIASVLIFIACDNASNVLDSSGVVKIEGKITNAGARSSYYGPKDPADPNNWGYFPSVDNWGNIAYNIVDEFKPTNSDTIYKNDTSNDGTVTKVIDSIHTVIPTMVWIVGGIGGQGKAQKEGYCMLEFPVPDGKSESDYENVVFKYDYDYHEPFLNHFDTIGVKVFLQVEAGMANMDTLVHLVMRQYKHHECVIGFGADIEWYPSPLDSDGNYVGDTSGMTEDWETAVTNAWVPISSEEVAHIDSLVKTYNPKYRIFVKHWEESICGGEPVSDVVYINDAQGMSFYSLVEDFRKWADIFEPNDVGFQIGYGNDYDWWILLDNPIEEVGSAIFNSIHKKNPMQNVHMYWVDFSLHYDKLGLYNDHPDAE